MSPRAYDSRAWRKARAAAIARDRYCYLANQGDCAGPLTVHHINLNPHDNTPSNLLTICRRHHGRIDGARSRGGRGR